ncbi:Scr1 family TA system antitoxin-like transcriptional regulator [Streptomyces sp. NPDC012421]|uniref:helix-turn-helix domain-containing protein n=1 Tax=unclassified Streptomyces TaxID=2593676 RepID=UPI0036C68AAE
MSVDEASNATARGADREVGADEGPGRAILAVLGRQLRAWREAKGLSAGELAPLIGYGEDMIRKVERGERIPRPEFLDMMDAALGAGGVISSMKGDVSEVRYPKRITGLMQLEAKAVEFCMYCPDNIHGLLQTEEFARALMRTWRPLYSPDQLEKYVAFRVARSSVLRKTPAAEFSFVQEEATLRRPIGGRMVLRRQLEHVLEVAELPNVEIQVMPTERADHPGNGGRIALLKFGDGTAAGRMDGDFDGLPVTDPRRLRLLDLHYGIIRSKALSPDESSDFIKRLLGEL